MKLPWSRPPVQATAVPPMAAFAATLNGLPAMLFDTADAGLLAIGGDGLVVRGNATLQQMVGPAVDLSPGAPAEHVFAAAERKPAWEEVRHAMLARPPRPAFATRLEDAVRGTDAAVEMLCATLRDAAGQPGGALLRFTDVTTRRGLEAQLAHSQKLQAVGQLAGGIAHDFNNLLTAILGGADAILERRALDDDSREDALQIRAGAGRGAALVRQLLAFGRQQNLQPEVVRVNVAIGDLAALLRRLLGSQIRLELTLEAVDLRVRADPSQLDQVLINLAVNARDAMVDGGTLTLRSGTMTLYRPLTRGVETIPPGRYVMIEVHDTGSGIPEDVLPRIFDPFFSTKRDRGGSGLGLSTVHGIVRQSDGFTAVESLPGQGTRMRVYLPRCDSDDAVAIPPLPASALPIKAAADGAPSRPGTVLLVEDEALVRRLAERVLVRHGWTVLAADCAEAALAALAGRDVAATPVVAIITDMVMPGLDGAALIAAVRARLARPDLPAILVSGYAEAGVGVASLRTANVSFLQKPYEMVELATKLAAVCRPHAP